MKKRLLFVNDEMVMGGVARILINTLKRLDYERYDVDVLILHPHGELMQDLPKQVRILPSTNAFYGVDVVLREALKQRNWLGIFRKFLLLGRMKLTNMSAFIQRQRAELNLAHYDVEIAAKEGFCSIFVGYGSTHRKINWIHVDYSVSNYSKHHMRLMRDVLPRFDAHIAVSNQAKKAYEALFKVRPIHSIPNVMDVEGILNKLKETPTHTLNPDLTNFIMVGRLHPQKAMHRAIYAMKTLPKDVHLHIVGEGPLKRELVQLSEALNLTERVLFLGQLTNPLPLIKQADCFLLPSLYEGYPTTVIEAFLAGVPVLACRVAGVDQQIVEGENGWVVANDEAAFSLKLQELVAQPKHLIQAKTTLVGYRYANDQYLQRFMDVVEGNV